MEIQIEHQQDKSVMILEKNIVVGSDAAKIQNIVLDLIQNDKKEIVADLSNLNYISSWGMGALIHALTTCTNRDVKFSLTGVNEKVCDIFKKVKLDSIFSLQDNH